MGLDKKHIIHKSYIIKKNMAQFIAFIVIFHIYQFWLFRVYTQDYDLDYKNPTKFECMMFWPQLLGIFNFPSK